MKFSKDTPAFLRYFTSRFKPLTNPLFWGSLGGLLIAGVAIYQYWQHPDWLETNSESAEEAAPIDREKLPNVSQEDLATGADIDNLDLLIKEIDENRTLSAIAESKKDDKSPELKREESAFSDLQKQQRAKLSNPNQSSSENYNSSALGIDEGNKKIMELLKPPSFSSYQSNKSNQNSNLKGSNQSQADIIPNPVGNIYLSDRTKQPSVTTTAPTPDLANPAVTSNNSSAINGVNSGVNPNGGVVPPVNGQNSQINTGTPPVNPNVSNTDRFVPASSLIQSQQTPATPITNLGNSSSSTGFNSFNPYPTNSTNNNNLNGTIPNSVSPINSNPSVANPNLTGTTPGTLNRPVQNTVIPGLSTGSNEIRREALDSTGDVNSPNSLQSNFRSYKSNSSNYNSSTPSSYQLQPQSYSSDGFNGAPSVNNQNSNRSNNIYSQPTNNVPVTNLGTPSLQPSGTLSTGEVGR